MARHVDLRRALQHESALCASSTVSSDSHSSLRLFTACISKSQRVDTLAVSNATMNGAMADIAHPASFPLLSDKSSPVLVLWTIPTKFASEIQGKRLSRFGAIPLYAVW